MARKVCLPVTYIICTNPILVTDMIRLILLCALFLSGCANMGACYFEAGVGSYINQDDIPNDVPSEANVYCEKGDFVYGLYHDSDVTRGRPFNNLEEMSTDKVMVHYRKRIN